MRDKEEKESFKSYIIGFIFNSICSVALPVSMSFYFAPEKSMEYFQNTVQDKVDSVLGINWDAIYEFGVAVYNEIPPMLKTEYDVLSVILENIPPAVSTAVYHIGSLDATIGTYIFLSLFFALAIAYWFFPFQEVKDWITNVLWGSICVVSGFLPLDSGMDVLADKEAGMYKMAVTLSGVISTLAANYLVVIISWWLIGKTFSFIWRGFVGLFTRKKNTKTDKTDKHNNKSNSHDNHVEDSDPAGDGKEPVVVPHHDVVSTGVGKDETSSGDTNQ